MGESFSLMKSKQLSYCKIWGAFKINGSDAIASFGGEFSPHQIPDLKSYCKFWGRIFTPSYSGFKKLLQVLGGTSASFGEPVKSTVPGYCKFWGRIFTPSNSWFKKLLQDLGESFSPMKSKQLSYCKIWGAFKINGSEAIASFGEPVKSTVPGYCKFWGELLQVLGSP